MDRQFDGTVAALASPGFGDVRWLKPVRPGDRLRLRVTVLDARRSRSKPDRGIVVSRLECLDHADAVVMRGDATGMMRVRRALPRNDCGSGSARSDAVRA